MRVKLQSFSSKNLSYYFIYSLVVGTAGTGSSDGITAGSGVFSGVITGAGVDDTDSGVLTGVITGTTSGVEDAVVGVVEVATGSMIGSVVVDIICVEVVTTEVACTGVLIDCITFAVLIVAFVLTFVAVEVAWLEHDPAVFIICPLVMRTQ